MGLTVIYDGQCAFCASWAMRLRRLDKGNRCIFLDGAAHRAEACALSGVSPEALDAALHVVASDGRVYAGYAAVRRLLWIRPVTRPLALLACLPGATALGDRFYSFVARHRHRSSL